MNVIDLESDYKLQLLDKEFFNAQESTGVETQTKVCRQILAIHLP